MMQAINDTMNINVGDILYDRNPAFGLKPITVTRVTKTLIIAGNAQYTRKGALKTDAYRRQRLYKQI